MLYYIAAFAFGPLLAIGCIGLYHFLSVSDRSPRLQIAAVSAVAGGVTLLIMLTVQQSIFGVIREGSENATMLDKAVEIKIRNGLNSVHWGMDIAWDVLICISMILFGWSMFKKTGLWKLLGAIGIILGLLLLALNLYFFPKPPASLNSIDWGPFVAIWHLAIFVMLRRFSASISKEIPGQ